MRRKNPAEFRLCPQCPAPQSSTGQLCYKINCAKHNENWSFVRLTNWICFKNKCWGDIFFLVLNFTLWNGVMSQYVDMVHIIWTLWVIIYVFWSKFVFCRKLILCTFKVQWYIQTIVNLKTIVDHCPQNFENHRKTIGFNGWTPPKHSMVMVHLCQNHWKTIDGNGGLKKKH